MQAGGLLCGLVACGLGTVLLTSPVAALLHGAAIGHAVANGDAAFPTLPDAPPFFVSDYDSGEVYAVRDGAKQAIHGLREAWVFNRALRWLDAADGAEVLICHSTQAPLVLTGRRQASRWYAGPEAELVDLDDTFTTFGRRAGPPLDHAALPPVQFPIEQHPVAELEVTQATHPWQVVVGVKGRSGPPLYASPWQDKPGKLRIDLLERYRAKGYTGHYAQLHFILYVRAPEPNVKTRLVFGLWLPARAAIVPSYPVIRTLQTATTSGVPICAVVLDANAKRLGREAVSVTVRVAGQTVALSDPGTGVWTGWVKRLPVGEHQARLVATQRNGGDPIAATLAIRITDGRFVGYDTRLKLLTLDGQPIGPLTGSYRGAPMFQAIGTPAESLVQGQAQWDAVKGQRHEGQYFNHGPAGPAYGFHFWEALTPAELDADYAYLARCGWRLTHLCQGWWIWERLDAGGRLAPHGAEQLAAVLAAAQRHGLRVHLALSHYPLGKASRPWSRYLEAGYTAGDYQRTNTAFHRMFANYLRELASVFSQDTALSSFTAAGEGDPDCGMRFVNFVHDTMQAHAPWHLFLCEPYHLPRPYPVDVNWYRRAGWKPLLGGMRTYAIDNLPFEHLAVQFKLASLGHIFLAEGVFWGFHNGPHATEQYRRRVRQTFYTGLAYRLPILLSWEERVTEDERLIFDQVQRAVDWTKPFAEPRLALRLGGDPNRFIHYERALARLPLEYTFLEKDQSAPAGMHVIDTTMPFEPRLTIFEAEGGLLPDALKSEMPLRLPTGFVASYSWSQDRTTLLAYLQKPDRQPGQALDWPATTEAGDFTYVDTSRLVQTNIAIDTWEVHCVRPGRIQFAVWRRAGDLLVRIGQTDFLEMTNVGLCRFTVQPTIQAKPGDLLGFYIPDENTHIAAEPGGTMLFVAGPVAETVRPLKQWQTEAKQAILAACSLAEAGALPGQGGAEAKSLTPEPAVVLQQFPARRLLCRLYDLDAKHLLHEAQFRQSCTLPVSETAEHLFLLVTEPPAPR